MKANRALWFAFFAVVADLASFYLIGAEETTLAVTVAVLGIAVAVSVAWLPAAVGAFRNGAKSAGDKITLSIWGAWTVLVLQRMYALFLTVLKRPDWLVDSPSANIIITLIAVAGVYAVYSTVSEANAPRQDRTWTLIAVAAGSFVAGGLAVYAFLTGLVSF